LHSACNDRHIPSLSAISLLIDSGIHPTADVNGDNPLHFLARLAHLNYIDGELVASVANLLLETGAHLDQRNNSRRTGAEVWNDRNEEKRRAQEDAERYQAEDEYWYGEEREVDEDDDDEGALELDDPPLLDMPSWLQDSVPKLECLAARVIRTHNVPFSKLPLSLKHFVQLH